MPLNDRVAIITGAAGSIGAATAQAFAAQRARLVLADLPETALHQITAELQSHGTSAVAVPTDVTNQNDVARLIEQTLDAFGRIDVLANVAGIGSIPSLCESTPEELERVVAVNLIGAARLMHAVLPVMKAQRSGSIVNVGSVAGETGVMGIYSASKFGLRGLNDSVRREVRSHNVSVSLIEPGFVRSPMNSEMNGSLPGPEIVARAIVAAVHRPRRLRIVPGSYALAVWATKAFPGLTDLVFGNARIQERLNRDSRAMRNGKLPNDRP